MTNETIRCIHDGACGINLPKHFVDGVGHEALIDRGAAEGDLLTCSRSATITTMKETTRPEFVTDQHLRFLDSVREDGKINMFGAALPLREIYADELSMTQARGVLKYWMETFHGRHIKDARANFQNERGE